MGLNGRWSIKWQEVLEFCFNETLPMMGPKSMRRRLFRKVEIGLKLNIGINFLKKKKKTKKRTPMPPLFLLTKICPQKTQTPRKETRKNSRKHIFLKLGRWSRLSLWMKRITFCLFLKTTGRTKTRTEKTKIGRMKTVWMRLIFKHVFGSLWTTGMSFLWLVYYWLLI